MVLQSILVALKSSMNLDSMHESVPVIKFTIKSHTVLFTTLLLVYTMAAPTYDKVHFLVQSLIEALPHTFIVRFARFKVACLQVYLYD